MTRDSPLVKGLQDEREIKCISAAIRIQAIVRGFQQRKRYERELGLAKMAAVRNHELTVTLQELDRAVRERELAETERLQAAEERRIAEIERLEAMNIKKNMIELRQKANLEYRQTAVEQSVPQRVPTKKLIRHAAAMVIQRAWGKYKGVTQKKPNQRTENTKRPLGRSQTENLNRTSTLTKLRETKGTNKSHTKAMDPLQESLNQRSSAFLAKGIQISPPMPLLTEPIINYNPGSYFSIMKSASDSSTPTSNSVNVMPEDKQEKQPPKKALLTLSQAEKNVGKSMELSPARAGFNPAKRLSFDGRALAELPPNHRGPSQQSFSSKATPLPKKKSLKNSRKVAPSPKDVIATDAAARKISGARPTKVCLSFGNFLISRLDYHREIHTHNLLHPLQS